MPPLDSNYPLNDEQRAHYAQHGHIFIFLPGVVSGDELAAYRPVINDAPDRFNTETRPFEERDTYGKAFLQIMNLWAQDEAVARFSLAKRFARIAAELVGVEGVRVYHYLEVGSMTFTDGSQKVGYLGDLPISDDSERMIADLIEERGRRHFSRRLDFAWRAGQPDAKHPRSDDHHLLRRWHTCFRTEEQIAARRLRLLVART